MQSIWPRCSLIPLFASVVAGCGGSGSSGDDSAASLATATIAPTVSAGDDIAVEERELVQLEGVVDDPDSSPVLSWKQVSGPTVEISNSAAAAATFMAPSVRGDDRIVLRLTALDGANAPVTDDVTIVVSNRGNGPEGPSSQGTPGDLQARRSRARANRGGRRTVASREVRSYDGTGNNIDQPEWGATFAHLRRLAAADYADGVEDLSGVGRPGARAVSNAIAAQPEGQSLPNGYGGSDFVWQWGQFIDHDLDLTDGAEEPADIPVPEGDLYFDPAGTGVAVIPFNRALYDPLTGTDPANPREQENEITAWIDGSMIYGATADRAVALRVGPDSPFLRTSTGNLLPFNVDALANANGFVEDPASLFLAGDIRVNEQLGLATMHTLFLREHNRIARLLQAEFPGRSGDELFEAARRLVIAKLQIITFEEWLPVLVGPDAIGAYPGYDSALQPDIYNEFSVAAFRLGHSMLNEQLLRLDADGGEAAGGPVSLASAFFTAPRFLTGDDALDSILRGMAAQAHQAIDPKVVHDLRNFLFGAPGDGGLDLVALNVQRGRDHGVSGYNATREALGLARRLSFAEVTSDPAVEAALAAIYDTVDDIDLWVGGLAEDVSGGSQLGPLFQAIVVKQFKELRASDRFWYERELSAQELARVQGTTLASVIRANTGIADEIQDNVFVLDR